MLIQSRLSGRQFPPGWGRSGLLFIAFVLTIAGARASWLRHESLSVLTTGVCALPFLLLVFSGKERASFWAQVFAVVFLIIELVTPGPYYGGGWFLAYAACVDANARAPIWKGISVTALLALSVVLSGEQLSAMIASFLYLGVLTLAGQLVRAATDAFESRLRASELQAALEKKNLQIAIHDSAGARLAQIVLIAQGIECDDALEAGLREKLALIVDVATSGVAEVRDAFQTHASRTSSGGMLSHEWERSIAVLRSAGFDLATLAQMPVSLPKAVEMEAARTIREATTNICKHASPNGQVAAVMDCSTSWLVFSWMNEPRVFSPQAFPPIESTPSLGLSGMSYRVRALGGEVEIYSEQDQFSLKVTFFLSEER